MNKITLAKRKDLRDLIKKKEYLFGLVLNSKDIYLIKKLGVGDLKGASCYFNRNEVYIKNLLLNREIKCLLKRTQIKSLINELYIIPIEFIRTNGLYKVIVITADKEKPWNKERYIKTKLKESFNVI